MEHLSLNATPKPIRDYQSFALSLLICFQILSPGSASAQQIPRVDEQNLAGGSVVLPDAVSGKVAVLILGFSRASKDPSSAWGRKLQIGFGSMPGFEVYSMPVLETVPAFVRSMVISGMRRGVPDNLRDHFVPVLHNEAEWKRLVNYKEPDDAYLVLLGRNGEVAYKTHGNVNDADYTQLRQHIQELLK